MIKMLQEQVVSQKKKISELAAKKSEEMHSESQETMDTAGPKFGSEERKKLQTKGTIFIDGELRIGGNMIQSVARQSVKGMQR